MKKKKKIVMKIMSMQKVLNVPKAGIFITQNLFSRKNPDTFLTSYSILSTTWPM